MYHIFSMLVARDIQTWSRELPIKKKNKKKSALRSLFVRCH